MHSEMDHGIMEASSCPEGFEGPARRWLGMGRSDLRDSFKILRCRRDICYRNLPFFKTLPRFSDQVGFGCGCCGRFFEIGCFHTWISDLRGQYFLQCEDRAAGTGKCKWSFPLVSSPKHPNDSPKPQRNHQNASPPKGL